jgi:serine/threonine protein kinase
MFSNSQPIYKLKFEIQELRNLHDKKAFPLIPNDINILLRDIISKCLERDHNNRINITELSYNLNILLDNITRSNYKQITLDESLMEDVKNKKNDSLLEPFSSTNSKLQETWNFINKLDTEINQISHIITNEIMDKTLNLKNNIEGGHENTIEKITDNYTIIKQYLSEYSMFKVEMLDKFKEKILSNILQMQQFYGIAMGDIIEGNNINYLLFPFSSGYFK